MPDPNPNPNPNPTPDPAPVPQPAPQPAPTPKTFTQEQLDEHVTNRLARERAKWHKLLGTEDEAKVADLLAKAAAHETLTKEVEGYKSKEANAAFRKELSETHKVDDAFLEYAMANIAKGKTPEETLANITTFVKANPKMLKESYSKINSNLPLNGNGGEQMPDPKDTEAWLKWRAKYNLDGTPRK